MQSCPVKCANEDAADCDSRMLDASWLWCDYSCLPQRHWKDGLAETGKRREFLVSNSLTQRASCASGQAPAVGHPQSRYRVLQRQWPESLWHPKHATLL